MTNASNLTRNQILMAYLTFLEEDARRDPSRIKPMTEAEFERIADLTRNVKVSDDDVMSDDVSV